MRRLYEDASISRNTQWRYFYRNYVRNMRIERKNEKWV